jgi:hypothetical protein
MHTPEFRADVAAAIEMTPRLRLHSVWVCPLPRDQYVRALALFLMALKPGRYDRRSTCQL